MNRTIRILKHYYKTEDIFIPQRKIGETFPEILLNFYESLIRQMCSDDYFIPFVKHMIKDINSDDSLSEHPNNKSKQKTKKSESEIEKADSSTMLTVFMNLDQNDIETLLHGNFVDIFNNNNNKITISYNMCMLYFDILQPTLISSKRIQIFTTQC